MNDVAGIGELVTRLSMDNRDFVKGANQAKSLVGSMAASITSALGPIAASFAGAFALGSAISGAKEAFAAEQKLTAVLAASGHAAGVTTEQIKAYAAQLQATTNFEDDATVSAAAMLASFGNIKGDQFTAVLTSAADLATVMGTDLTSAVSLLGKALNNPAEGLTKLARSGVTFTDSQEAMIKSLTESGNIMGAQQVILGALEAKFKGAAAAVADPFKQLQNNIGDVGESLGAGLLPVLNALAKTSSAWLAPMNALLGQNTEAIGYFAKAIIGASVAFVVLKVAVIAYEAWQKRATIAAIFFQGVLNPALLVKVAAGIVIATATVVAMDAAMSKVAGSAPAATAGLRGMGLALSDVGDEVAKIEKISDIAKAVADLRIKEEGRGDSKKEERIKLVSGFNSEVHTEAERTSFAGQLAEFDRLTLKTDALTAANERWKRSQDDAARAESDMFAKIGEHQKSAAALKDEIAVLTGEMTKQEAAVKGFQRQGFDKAQSEDLAKLEAERDAIKAGETPDKSKSVKPDLKAAFAGTSEAASIMLRGVGGGKSIEAIASKQLTVAEKQLVATKELKPPEMFAIIFGAG